MSTIKVVSRPVLDGSSTSRSGSQPRRRREAELVVRLLRHVRTDSGLRGTVEGLADDLLSVLSASRILLAARETTSGGAFLWTAERAPQAAKARLQSASLGPSAQESYFFEAPPTWCAFRRRGAREQHQFETISISGGGERLRHEKSSFVPKSFAFSHPCRSCLGVDFEFGFEWTCRLFVLDAKPDRHLEDTLRLVRGLADELTPAFHNVYLVHHSQTRAAAIERASLARALHDDLIQSLIAAEMRVHAAFRRAVEGSQNSAAELLLIEKLLHQEVLGVRDLMRRIKPIHLEGDELCDFVADCVQKFEGDTGIRASFFADVTQVSLSAPMCTEVARIVQEALSNVRKHSGARSVCVRVQEADHRWRLVIEDDGRGLAAVPAGVHGEGAALGHHSPTVIKECVRSLGGELKLLPAAGGGLRLEISFSAYGTHREVPPAPSKTMTRLKMASATPALHTRAEHASDFGVVRSAARRFVRSSARNSGRR